MFLFSSELTQYINLVFRMVILKKSSHLLDFYDFYEIVGNHAFVTYTNFYKKLAFLTPWHAHVRVHVRG